MSDGKTATPTTEPDTGRGLREALEALEATAELGRIVAKSYIDGHKPDTLRDPKTGEEVRGLIAETVVALIQAVIANGVQAAQALAALSDTPRED